MIARCLMSRANVVRRFNVDGLHIKRDWSDRCMLTHHGRQVPFDWRRIISPRIVRPATVLCFTWIEWGLFRGVLFSDGCLFYHFLLICVLKIDFLSPFLVLLWLCQAFGNCRVYFRHRWWTYNIGLGVWSHLEVSTWMSGWLQFL